MSSIDDKTEVDKDSDSIGYEFPSKTEDISTILIIECRSRENETIKALEAAYKNNKFNRAYGFLFFRWFGKDRDSCLERLERWLKLEAKKIDLENNQGGESEDQLREHNIQLSKLKAVIIGWDTGEHGLDVIKKIRHYRPNLPIFIVNYKKGSGQAKSYTQLDLCHFFRKNSLGGSPIVFEGKDMLGNEAETLLKKIDQIVSNYREAPYWEALKEYAKRPVISFHALPVGHKRSMSPSIVDFVEFYGSGHFSAETSLAADPLDSLLDPSGPLQEAQEKAAIAFGAQAGSPPITKVSSIMKIKQSPLSGTRFVTNGTSTANKIVHTAFVRPKNYVLIDRNCHISHHYALAYCDAHPRYLKPFKNKDGIWGPVSLDTIRDEFIKLANEKGELPSAIVLTNPTFDGFFCKPDKVIEEVVGVLEDLYAKKDGDEKATYRKLVEHINGFHKNIEGLKINENTLQEDFLESALKCIVFLFDEAWSAFAYFHPKYIEYTAMKASLVLNQSEDKKWVKSVRIYSTQSTHKSLSALRQGSMIHFKDPLFKHPQVFMQFEQACRAHTTTSPNASILASLDVARRQAQLEGTELVDMAFRLAKDFRSLARNHSKKIEKVSKELNDELKRVNFPCKVQYNESTQRLSHTGTMLEEKRDELLELSGDDQYKKAVEELYLRTQLNKYFDIITEEEMFKGKPPLLESERLRPEEKIQDFYFADPTRVTIIPKGDLADIISGVQLKKLLLTKDIQVNKYEGKSILAIFNIGVTESSKNTLLRALCGLANELSIIKDKLEKKVPKPRKNGKGRGGDKENGLQPCMDLLHDKETLGYWLKNEGKYEIDYCIIDKTKCKDKEKFFILPKCKAKSGCKYIFADFIVPYPPGYPIFVPGQEIIREELEKLAGITITEIHGAIIEGDEIKIPVYVVKDENAKGKKGETTAKTARKKK